jgi:uncharacterized protein YmfQ (DUF2313 family)
MTAKEYRALLLALAPPGRALPRNPESTWAQLLHALAEELARVDVRHENLLDESDVRTTAELLSGWERVTGLPDDCAPAVQTLAERRDALIHRLVNLGGQSRQFFIDLAARLGYTITISEPKPFRVDRNAVGDGLNADEWAFVWQVEAPINVTREFRVQENAVGDALRSWGDELLECVIGEHKPAHTLVQFSYS